MDYRYNSEKNIPLFTNSYKLFFVFLGSLKTTWTKLADSCFSGTLHKLMNENEKFCDFNWRNISVKRILNKGFFENSEKTSAAHRVVTGWHQSGYSV